jgi:hypothetical protein
MIDVQELQEVETNNTQSGEVTTERLRRSDNPAVNRIAEVMITRVDGIPSNYSRTYHRHARSHTRGR